MYIVSTINLNEFSDVFIPNKMNNIFVYQFNNDIILYLVDTGTKSIIKSNITNNEDLTNSTLDFNYLIENDTSFQTLLGITQITEDIYINDSIFVYNSPLYYYFSQSNIPDFNLLIDNNKLYFPFAGTIIELNLDTNNSKYLFNNNLYSPRPFAICKSFLYTVNKPSSVGEVVISYVSLVDNNIFELPWYTPLFLIRYDVGLGVQMVSYSSIDINCLFIINYDNKCIAQIKIVDK